MNQSIDVNALTEFDLRDLKATKASFDGVDDLHQACVVVAQAFEPAGLDILAITFCDQSGERPSIRPYRDQPEVLVELSKILQNEGGCPILKQAINLGVPFRALEVPMGEQTPFVAKRYLEELGKLDHTSIWAFPIGIGRGMAVISLGTRDKTLEPRDVEHVYAQLCNFIVNLLVLFPDLAKLFETKVLNLIETECLLLLSNGTSIDELCKVMGLSEFAIAAITKSAQKKLGTTSIASTVSKAAKLGEIHKMQLGPHDVL